MHTIDASNSCKFVFQFLDVYNCSLTIMAPPLSLHKNTTKLFIIILFYRKNRVSSLRRNNNCFRRTRAIGFIRNIHGRKGRRGIDNCWVRYRWFEKTGLCFTQIVIRNLYCAPLHCLAASSGALIFSENLNQAWSSSSIQFIMIVLLRLQKILRLLPLFSKLISEWSGIL